MRPRRALLLAVLLGLFPLPLRAAYGEEGGQAGRLTVDELVARVLADNPELRAAGAEVEAARQRVGQAALRPNPMLELNGMQSVTGPDNTLSVGVTLPLDLNGRKAGRVAVAERERELARARVADQERRLRAEARLKAGEILAARRNLGFTEDLLEANRKALELVRERVRRGGAPPLDENLMLVEVNRLEASRRLLEARVEVLTLQAKALAGLSPEAPLSIVGDLAAPFPALERADALARALTGRSDLVAARTDLAVARARVQKERAEGRWDASLSVGYQRQASGFDLNGLTDDGVMRPIEDVFHMVGGGVTIMLPLRNRNQGSIAAAVAETRAAASRLDLAALVVQQEIAAAFAQQGAAQRALEIYREGVREVARQNLEVVRRTHELGRIPLLDVIAEQRRYIEVETGYTDALTQAYDAAVEIERAVGATDR